jgi:hypothetical protein
LTALHALRSIPLTLPPIRRLRAPLISWWAPISASPRRGAPRSAALSSAGGECASTSDTPCRDVLRAFRRAARHRDRLPPGLVKGQGSERSRMPSIDECPLGPPPSFRNTSALEREPATGPRAWPPVTRLPTLFRRPAPWRGWLDRDRFRALFTPGRFLATRRSSTSAIETIRKHDLRTSKPDAHGGRSAFTELLSRSTGPHFDGAAPVSRRDSTEAEPSSHGSGAVFA